MGSILNINKRIISFFEENVFIIYIASIKKVSLVKIEVNKPVQDKVRVHKMKLIGFIEDIIFVKGFRVNQIIKEKETIFNRIDIDVYRINSVNT